MFPWANLIHHSQPTPQATRIPYSLLYTQYSHSSHWIPFPQPQAFKIRHRHALLKLTHSQTKDRPGTCQLVLLGPTGQQSHCSETGNPDGRLQFPAYQMRDSLETDLLHSSLPWDSNPKPEPASGSDALPFPDQEHRIWPYPSPQSEHPKLLLFRRQEKLFAQRE